MNYSTIKYSKKKGNISFQEYLFCGTWNFLPHLKGNLVFIRLLYNNHLTPVIINAL